PDRPENSIKRVAEIWILHYEGETGQYPVKGNQFIGWLAKLLSKPDHNWTVAGLLGDPGGKLEAGSLPRAQCAMDRGGLRKIDNRIKEIDEITKETGGSESLEGERATLLQQVQVHSATERMPAPVKKAYDNITTQKRQFLLKLAEEMPQLAAHLKACIIP